MTTNKNYNVDLASLSDSKLMYDPAKEMYFDVTSPCNKPTLDRIPIKILKAPSLMKSASGIPVETFLLSDPDELCDRLKLLLEEKQAGNNSFLINEEIVVILDNMLENKCKNRKHPNQNLIECNLMHIKRK